MSVSQKIVDPEVMRRAMRNWATGVTVVSSVHQDVRHGMTVSSLLSVALDPALILVSLQMKSRTHRLVKNSGIFGVTILDASQQAISDRFAGRHTERLDRFRSLETFTLVTGAPFLVGGMVFLDCQVCEAYEIAGHTLFVGQVLAVKTGSGDHPLVYYNRDYFQISQNDKPDL